MCFPIYGSTLWATVKDKEVNRPWAAAEIGSALLPSGRRTVSLAPGNQTSFHLHTLTFYSLMAQLADP